jgi:putative chitinase
MLDVQTIQKLSGSTPQIAQIWLPLMEEYFPKYNINTKERIASFLSQVGEESGGLYYTEEIASGSTYEGRSDLGNTQTGDGVRFKGRGLLETTGRNNYQNFKNKFGVDVISNPSLLGGKNALVSTPEQLKNSLMSALYYWDTHNLNSLADNLNISMPATNTANLDTITKITKIINGGLNGLQDRLNRFENGRSYIKDKILEVATFSKNNWIPIVAVFVGVVGLGYYLFASKTVKV